MFPTLTAHHVHTNREGYSEEGLSLQKMYRLYLDYCKNSEINATGTLRQYSDVLMKISIQASSNQKGSMQQSVFRV